MGFFNKLFGTNDSDEEGGRYRYRDPEIQELVDKLDAYSDALDERIAQKQKIYDELCDEVEEAKETVEHLEKAIKYEDN